MIHIKDFGREELCNLITIAYNGVRDDVDLMIVGKIQEYLNLGYSEEEAKKELLSKYRDEAKNDKSRIIKNLGRYRSAYNDFFDEDPESYLEGYSEKAARSLANELFKSDNSISKYEFENKEQLIEYFADKIECFEIINRINIPTKHGNKNKVAAQSNSPLEKMIKFNRDNNNYLFDYLDELKSVFIFDKISDLDFNAICLIIKEKDIFNKKYPFTEVVASIASYYEIETPKAPKPNKCKQRKKELLGKYSILERSLI